MKWGDLNVGDQYIEDDDGVNYPRRVFVVTSKTDAMITLHCAALGDEQVTALPPDESIMYSRSKIVRFDNTITEDPL